MNGEKSSLATLSTTLSALVLLAIPLMVLSFGYSAQHDNFDRQYIEYAEAVRVQSQAIAKNAAEAANGRTDAFFQLAEARSQVEANIGFLRDGDPATGLPATASYDRAAADSLDNVIRPWGEMSNDIDRMLQREAMVIAVNELAEEFRVSLPGIQQELQELAEALQDASANRSQIGLLMQGTLAVERIGRSTGEMLRGGIGNMGAGERLGESRRQLQDILASLAGNGPMDVPALAGDSRERLLALQSDFNVVGQQIDQVLDQTPQLFDVRDAADAIFVNSDRLQATTEYLLSVYRGLSQQRMLPWWTGFAIIGLAFILLVARAFVTRALAREQLSEKEAEKRKSDDLSKSNQQAILDLLDEIQGLSEGDLTVHASVGEAFTGAIGDAFNDSIDALRSLVLTINETSVQVSSAAQQTQATAMHLAEASDHQAHQITAASSAINDMALSIEQVSKNSQESAEVAQRSVSLATRGADTVRRTIQGMDSIREQIQETSKRIKRLGESSQEIGNIVELINDIADQTNILALNASIQAAMAGEAGRGFAVVADEVQRLAERSGNATKQIEALVKTIQTDTNEAVISMEESTTGVVSGARLAEDAGEALREIESTSQQLAVLIQSITESARQQSLAASNVSDTMNVIQEITTQTSAGTNETATSIGNLADLANDLRNSVSGFKLPE